MTSFSPKIKFTFYKNCENATQQGFFVMKTIKHSLNSMFNVCLSTTFLNYNSNHDKIKNLENIIFRAQCRKNLKYMCVPTHYLFKMISLRDLHGGQLCFHMCFSNVYCSLLLTGN